MTGRSGPRRVVLTGASSGIGAALAVEMAQPGRHLLLLGRDAARLDAVAARARAAGSEVETALMPVTDRAGLAEVLLAHDRAGAIDLLIANAGVAAGRTGGTAPEAEGVSARMIDTNLTGMLNTVEPLLPRFIDRRAGQIVLVSSLAAIRPHGDLPSYSAAKAGVRAWGIAIRAWLRPLGVRVTVVAPGFVTSPMSARHQGPKPFEMPADRAARLILRGILRGSPAITFPWQLALLVWLENRLPPALADRLERLFAANIVPEEPKS